MNISNKQSMQSFAHTHAQTNRRSALTLCLGLGLTLALVACQTPTNLNKPAMPNTIDEKKTDNQSTERHVAVGETFTISLSSNPTTGYSWMLTKPLDKNHLELVSNTYVSDKHPVGMVGVGGTETWTFKALKAGKAQIDMANTRSWEKATPAQTAQYQIHIN